MSVEADIGQKIKEAIDFYLTQADSARLAAQLISDYWGERDYRWLAESGVITQREADIMLGVRPNGYPGGDPRIADALSRVFRAAHRRFFSETLTLSMDIEMQSALAEARRMGASEEEIARAIQQASRVEPKRGSRKPKRNSRKSKRTSRRAR